MSHHSRTRTLFVLALLTIGALVGSLRASAWTNPTTAASGIGGGALTISSGRVGIGTNTSLTEKFEVAGTLRLQGSDAVYKATTPNGKTHHLIGTYGGWDSEAVYIAGYNAVTPEFGDPVNSSTSRVYFGRPERLSVDLVSGNVGIGTGTASPSSRLTVAGDIAVTTQGRGVILQSADGSSCSRLVTNSAGAILLSGVNCATGVAVPTLPSAPQNLSAVGGDARVTLTWAQPLTNGGSSVTAYRVYRGTSYSSQSFVGTTPATVYADLGRTNATTYYYRVSAVTSVGEGASGSVASAIAGVLPGSPGAVGMNELWPSYYNNGLYSSRIQITWTPPVSSGTNPILYYNIRDLGKGRDIGTKGSAMSSLLLNFGGEMVPMADTAIRYFDLNFTTTVYSPFHGDYLQIDTYDFYPSNNYAYRFATSEYCCQTAWYSNCTSRKYYNLGPIAVSAVTAVGEGPATMSTWPTSPSPVCYVP